jgi:hypothetical protein
MKRDRAIIALTGAMAMVAILLFLWLHDLTRKEVLILFQGHQLATARYLANKIESFLWSNSQGLHLLPSPGSLFFERVKQVKAYSQTFSKHMEKGHIKGASLYDKTGSVVYSTGYETIGSNQGESEFFLQAKKRENKGKVLVGCEPGRRRDGSRMFLLTAPVYQGFPPKDKFIGALSFSVDLEEFIIKQLDFVDGDAGRSLRPADWIMLFPLCYSLYSPSFR